MTPRLDGRTVVVTRGAVADDALATRLRQLGATVRDFPAVVFGPPGPEDEAALDAALRRLPSYAWAVFASGQGVEHTVARLEALGLPRGQLADLRLACVGAATAARLEALVRAPDLVPTEATGAALAACLARHVRGAEVLVPRVAEGRPELVDGLLAAGARVTAPVAYRNLPAPPATLAPLGDLLADGAVQAVAFASPSAVRSVVAALGPRAALLGRVLLGAIGPTTAAALTEAGLRPGAVPAVHSAGALADEIAVRLAGG
jgi:uroporphyrinogen-III synthase